MKTGKWSIEELDYIRNHYVKDGSIIVGKALNRSHRHVGSMASHLGIKRGWGKVRIRKYAINDRFFNTWGRKSAYIVGLILADGNLSPSGREFSISSKDIELLEKAKRALESEQPIRKINGKNLYMLSIGNKRMVNDLEKIGITQNKSKTLTMPDVPDEYFFDFLRGYIDGDGMIDYRHKKGITVKLCTGSPYILDDISSIISTSLNIHKCTPATRTGKRRETISTWYELIYYGQNAAKICEAIYSHREYLFLSRKRQAYIDYRDRPKHLGLRHNGNATRYK